MLFFVSLSANIDTQIEAIRNAPVEERFMLMNAFKKEIVHMQEKERIDAITKLKSITQSPLPKAVIVTEPLKSYKNILNQSIIILAKEFPITKREPK